MTREFGIFLIVGSLTVAVDYSLYSLLLGLNTFSVDFAKGLGFLGGTLFAYLANRHWTFKRPTPVKGSLLRFFLLYASTLLVNVVINKGCLALAPVGQASFAFAFLLATGVSAMLNFLGMKYLVFHSMPSEELV